MKKHISLYEFRKEHNFKEGTKPINTSLKIIYWCFCSSFISIHFLLGEKKKVKEKINNNCAPWKFPQHFSWSWLLTDYLNDNYLREITEDQTISLILTLLQCINFIPSLAFWRPDITTLASPLTRNLSNKSTNLAQYALLQKEALPWIWY